MTIVPKIAVIRNSKIMLGRLMPNINLKILNFHMELKYLKQKIRAKLFFITLPLENLFLNRIKATRLIIQKIFMLLISLATRN